MGLTRTFFPPAQMSFAWRWRLSANNTTTFWSFSFLPALNPSIASAYEICQTLHSSASVHIIDSQATSVGLGLIVQAAAEAAWNDMGIAEIKRMLNWLIPRVYTIYCTQSLTYLSHSGQLDQAQALVGEMMGVTAFFLMEHGSLIPVQKARNARNMVDIFEEFIMEFGDLRHIAHDPGSAAVFRRNSVPPRAHSREVS